MILYHCMDNIRDVDTQSPDPVVNRHLELFPRYRQIYEYLFQEISSGKLKPGNRMPSEKELCSAFGVSRITSKKALEMLTENHLISRQRGKGSFVVAAQQNSSSFRTIALLISSFNDFFGNRLICSMETACEALGYHLILKLTHESTTEEEKALRALEDENVAGILMIPVHGEYYNAEILRQILNNRPLVFVDRKMQGLPVPSVSTDCVSASRKAVCRLLEQGHRNIAFYSGPVIHSSTVEDRQQGFVKAFTDSGVPLNPAFICAPLPSLDSLDIITRHLSEHPEISGAFTSEFEIALLVKRATAALGRRIPHDFALTTFDWSGFTAEFPEITCLRQDEDSIGRQAVEILHRIIQGEPSKSIGDILVPAELIPGEDITEKI